MKNYFLKMWKKFNYQELISIIKTNIKTKKPSKGYLLLGLLIFSLLSCLSFNITYAQLKTQATATQFTFIVATITHTPTPTGHITPQATPCPTGTTNINVSGNGAGSN